MGYVCRWKCSEPGVPILEDGKLVETSTGILLPKPTKKAKTTNNPDCLVRCGNRRDYIRFPGKIVAKNTDGTVQVEFDGTGKTDMSVPQDHVLPDDELKVGDKVEATMHKSKWMSPVEVQPSGRTKQNFWRTR